MNEYHFFYPLLFLHKNPAVIFFLLTIWHSYLWLLLSLTQCLFLFLNVRSLVSIEIILTKMASYLNMSTNSLSPQRSLLTFLQLPLKCSPNFPVRNHYFP